MTLAYVELKRAEVALADAEHEQVRASLDRIAELVAGSREPQFIGLAGSLRGELERRGGDLTAARAAVDDGLDAIEFCSEDLARIARLSETGTSIEADAAQRARDLGDGEAEREAISRAEGFVMRGEGCARRAGPSRWPGSQRRARTSRAPAAPAIRRSTPRRPPPGAPCPAPTRRRSRSCGARRRSRRRATAKPRPPSSPRCSPPPTRSAPRGCAARPTAWPPAPGWPWRPASTGRRSRARRDGGDPFGLTPRERQVLALVADGATNREIGAQLYMAEKTASVHVSRILAKLDVRSRTEAAAVAHASASARDQRRARLGDRRTTAESPERPDPRRGDRRRLPGIGLGEGQAGRRGTGHLEDAGSQAPGRRAERLAAGGRRSRGRRCGATRTSGPCSGCVRPRRRPCVRARARARARCWCSGVLGDDGAEAESSRPTADWATQTSVSKPTSTTSSVGDADRFDRLLAGGQAEGRLLDRRRHGGHARGSPGRCGRCARAPPRRRGSGSRAARRAPPSRRCGLPPRPAFLRVVLAQPRRGEEAGLSVDDDEHAVVPADQRHGR